MKYIIIFSCFIGILVYAEKQINLEDIERDNLANEKKVQQEKTQAHKPSIPNSHNYDNHQPFRPIKPPAYYTPPTRPATIPYQPQQFINYITDNHLPATSSIYQPTLQHQIQPQIQPQVQSQIQPHVQPHTQPQYTFAAPSTAAYQPQQYYYVQPYALPSYSFAPTVQPKTGGIQYVMYIQPTTAASFIVPQTQEAPTFNTIPNLAHLSSPQLTAQLYAQLQQSTQATTQTSQPVYNVPPQQAVPQTQQLQPEPATYLVAPQQKQVLLRPELNFVSLPTQKPYLVKPTVAAQQQIPEQEYIFVQRPPSTAQHEVSAPVQAPISPIKPHQPKSLLDSYVPSVLQIQYLKAQQLKQQQFNGGKNLQIVVPNSLEQTTDLDVKDSASAPVKSSASNKQFQYQTYLPIEHGSGGQSYINYRLGRYASRP